jgi:NAD(P)-dependent dehydrogenase (short-subunit alcohol dehydrogenase family)
MGDALSGRSALILGGSSGIGLASARALAADGARVTIASRGAEKLQAAAQTLADDGLEVAWTVCDAMDGASVRDAVDVASDNGRLHMALAVPGGGTVKPVLLYGDDEFGMDIDRNVRPVFLAIKYAGAAIVRAGGGSLVAVSSTSAVFSSRYLSAYAAAKAAIDQLVRVAADELGEYGVRVNGVRPGLTRTAATGRLVDNADVAAMFVAQQAIGRNGLPQDIAAAVRFLAGPESSWVTGQLLTVDGGHTLRAFIDYRDIIEVPDQGRAAQDGLPA